MSPADPSSNRSRVARFGDFSLDLLRGELSRDGDAVNLRPKAVPVLVELVDNAGSLVTRERLVEAAWGDVQTDVASSLHNVVRHLRDVLDDDASRPRYIETVYGRGYRFVADVEMEAARRTPPGLADGADTPVPRRLFVPVLALLGLLVATIVVAGLVDATRTVEPSPDVLRGRYLAIHGDGQQLREGLALLRLAVEREETPSALVWSGIAAAEARLRNFDEADRAARRALDLDPGSAAAIRVLGEIDMYRHRDWESAERRLLRALSLDPNDAGTHVAYATLLLILDRRDDALYEARLARGLAALSPGNRVRVARIMAILGEHRIAVEESRRALALDPSLAEAHAILHGSLRAVGEIAAARDALAEYLASCQAGTELLVAMREAEPDTGLRMGHRWLATRASPEIAREAGRYLYRAVSRTLLGDHEGAWNALAAAEDRGEPLLPLLLRDPRLTPLHAEDRFAALLSRLDLPFP